MRLLPQSSTNLIKKNNIGLQIASYIKRRGLQKFLSNAFFKVVCKIESIFLKRMSKFNKFYSTIQLNKEDFVSISVRPQISKSGLIYSYAQEEIPSYGEIDLGDSRIRGRESLSNLVHKTFPEANITIETNVVTIEGSVNQVSEIAAGFFYAAFVLKPERRKLMIISLTKLLAISKKSSDSQIQGRFSMPINRLLVKPNIK